MTAAVHNTIQFSDDWEPPEQLSYDIDQKFAQKVAKAYEGLKTINLKARFKNEDNQPIMEPLPSMQIVNGGKGKTPGVDAEVLAQMIWARGNEHAIKHRQVIKYDTTFYGQNEDGKPWTTKGQFILDGRTEEEEIEEVFDLPPPRRGEGVQVLSTGNSRRPATLQSETISALHLSSQQNAGVFAELRASMQQQRLDYSDMLHRVQQDYSNIVTDVRGLLGEVHKELKNSREEASKANARIIKMANDQTQHFANQQEANKQGWEAFHAGMQMQLQSMQQSMSWERQIMMMQFDQLATETNKEERTSIVKEWGPLILGAAGQILESKGSPAGKLLQEYALKTMEDEDEDEDEDEEETDEPKEASSGLGVPAGQDPRKHFDKNPIVSMVQLLNSLLTKEQHKKLKELLPPMTWKALDSALKAKKDLMAKAFLMQFVAQVRSVKGLDDKLKAELTEEQFELFNDIAEVITKGMPKKPVQKPVIDVEVTGKVPPTPQTGPPPPPSRAVAGDEPPIPKAKPPTAPKAKPRVPTIPPWDPKWKKAELRRYAKKHYGLDLPERMGKPKMLNAIQEAAKEKVAS